MTDTTKAPDGLLPDGWENFTIRMKKDPSLPYNGTDIEFNGARYVRVDLAPQAKPVDVEILRQELRTVLDASGGNQNWHKVDKVIDHLAQRGFFSHTPDLDRLKRAVGYFPDIQDHWKKQATKNKCLSMDAYETIRALLNSAIAGRGKVE